MHGTHAQVRARFVERFSMGAPYCGEVVGPAISGLNEKVSWVSAGMAGGSWALRRRSCKLHECACWVTVGGLARVAWMSGSRL